MQRQIENSIAFLRGNIRLQFDSKYADTANGLSFYISFHGLDYQPVCDINPDPEDPLVYHQATKTVEIVRNYGESLLFEPIPMEWLSTNVQNP